MDQKSSGRYRKLKTGRLQDLLEWKYHYGLQGHDQKQIISSAGTCSGDSGGPLYQVRTLSSLLSCVEQLPLQEVGRDYVVTGLVR